MTLLNVIRLKPTEFSILITINQCFWLYFIISWIFVFDAGHNHSNYHAHYVSLIIWLNDGPVRVLSQSVVVLPDLQLSDAPRLVQTPDCVTLSHTEVHSPGARLPAGHCLPAVLIITFQLESTLVIPLSQWWTEGLLGISYATNDIMLYIIRRLCSSSE